MNWFGRIYLLFLLLASLTGCSSGNGGSDNLPAEPGVIPADSGEPVVLPVDQALLPADRAVTWQGNVGVKGDIPSRSVIYKTLSPSGGDDTAAINAAIANCPSGQVVKLNAGTFKVSREVTVKSGITLRGAGMGVTTLKGAAGMSSSYIAGINAESYFGTSFTISAGLAKGSTAITTTTAHGWSVGDIILIDQLNDPGGDPVVSNIGIKGTCTWCGRANGTRSLGQINKVITVPSATTATLETPLAWNFAARLTPQATKINNMAVNAGIENLTVDNLASALATNMLIYGSSNCWLLNIEVIGSNTNSIKLQRAYRNTIRSCKLHEGTPAVSATDSQYGINSAYGIYMNTASGCLIENSQFYHLVMATKLDGPVTGNVFAYNIVSEMIYSTYDLWQVDAFRTHGAHPIMNLFEGNYLNGRVNADMTWGSSSHNTFFRNRNTLGPTRTEAAWNYSLYKLSSYYNIIGNVIGTTGFESTYTTTIGSSENAIYGIDPAVAATTLINANWDSVTDGTVWNGANDRVLPASLYLTGKPGWWGSVGWPAIGPDISPKYPSAPAIGEGTPW